MDMTLRKMFEKHAEDNGFSIPKGERDGWLIFQAPHAPSQLALCQLPEEKTLLIGTSHQGVGEELSTSLASSPVRLDGFDCFVTPSFNEMFQIIGRIWKLARSLPNGPLDKINWNVEENLSSTEVERLRIERIGQDDFRKALMKQWDSKCAVTGVDNLALLRASHIIPWASCKTNEERVNVYNGLLLVAHLDAAFDAGLISFDETGGMMISSFLSEFDQKALNIVARPPLKKFNPELMKRLKHHRSEIFRE